MQLLIASNITFDNVLADYPHMVLVTEFEDLSGIMQSFCTRNMEDLITIATDAGLH